ncbi:MAG TPA: hypothetical protein VGK54_08410 [Chloroflexota bacterium]
MDQQQYLHDAEAFHGRLNLEYYLAGAGLKTGLDLTPIYDDYVHLFEGERYDELAAWDLEAKQVRYVQAFVADGNLSAETRRFSEKLAAAEAAAMVTWEDRPVPYREMPILIANEADAGRRHAMEQAYLSVMASLNPLLEDREKRLQRGGRGFGHSGYIALYDDLKELELKTLTETMQQYLADTSGLYFSALDTYLHEMNILREDSRRCDVARIFRAPQYDVGFPADRMLPSLHAALRELGIDLGDQTQIHLDTESRPLKSPRAFCSVIQVPGDIRLVIKPSGGEQDFEALFHEAGHAEHYANIDRTLPFAYRYLGDDSLTESYAFLLEYLLNDRAWLNSHLEYDAPAGFCQLMGFHKLYMLRRYATKLIYEQLLHDTDEPGDLPGTYDELMRTHLGVSYGPEGYLTDVDDGFYCAAYLRAWIFEAQHRGYLVREFGDDWFRNPKAGKFLRELWRDGQKYNVVELARFMGYEGLDIGPVAANINELMGAR